MILLPNPIQPKNLRNCGGFIPNILFLNISSDELRKHSAGLLFAVGGMILILFTTASEAAFLGYSIRTDAISGLGGAGSPTELFWNFQLFVAGLLWCIGSLMAFWKERHPIRTSIFFITGIGLIIVSLFPWNVAPVEHGLGAQVAAYFGIASCFSSYGITTRPFRYLSLFAGFFSLGALLLGFVGFSLIGPGGLERMLYYPIFLWEIGLGGYLMGWKKTDSSSNA